MIISSFLSGFVFIADYWAAFQGALQDYMFYLTFVIPGILYSIALSFLLSPKNFLTGGRIAFVATNQVVWILLYVFCLKGYIEGYVSEASLQILIVICGLIGAMSIGALAKTIFKTDDVPVYYLGGIGMASVLIAQFVIAPIVTIFFRFEIMQVSGIIVLFWQLGIGVYYWYTLYSKPVALATGDKDQVTSIK